jgi:hypothetical protein
MGDGRLALILTGLKDLKGVWTSLENRAVGKEDIKRHIVFRCDLIGIGVRVFYRNKEFDHRFATKQKRDAD